MYNQSIHQLITRLSLFIVIVFFNSSGIVNSQDAQQMQDYISSIVEAFERDFATLNRELLAKAKPDECFFGIGDTRNSYTPSGIECGSCLDGSQPKVNQAYVWGLAKTDKDLWYGTGPNVHCLVISGFLGSDSPIQTDSYACEYGDSQFDSGFPSPIKETLGDFRPPRIYRYNLDSKVNQDITPSYSTATLLPVTLGIRSAGAHNGVVFFAGPGLNRVNFFAFDSDTGEYLGQKTFGQYNNIRKWLVYDNVLYTAVAGTAGGGKVLKWIGSKTDPFKFEEVGDLNAEGAELAIHEGRLFVTTWPSFTAPGNTIASLYMSPLIPSGGLTAADKANWEIKWKVTDYETDPVTAATYGGGALHSFDGHLYWGTMHVPFLSTIAHFRTYGIPSTPDSVFASILGTFRAISIFRGKDFDSNSGPDIELLYGSPILPKYSPVNGWSIMANANNQIPLYGLPGFGNPFNNYTWTMSTYENQLYVGTMDFSYLLFGELDINIPMTLPVSCDGLGLGDMECQMLEKAYMTFAKIFNPANFVGADLMRFADANSPAIPESIAGVGNNSSYGIRTMIGDNDGLFLGMANPMNLLTCSDNKSINNGDGGWSLMCLRSSSHSEPIPTLGEWGYFILTLGLFIVALLTLGQNNVREVDHVKIGSPK